MALDKYLIQLTNHNSFDSGNELCSKSSCCWFEYMIREINSQICHALYRHGDKRYVKIGGKYNLPGDGYDCSKFLNITVVITTDMLLSKIGGKM